MKKYQEGTTAIVDGIVKKLTYGDLIGYDDEGIPVNIQPIPLFRNMDIIEKHSHTKLCKAWNRYKLFYKDTYICTIKYVHEYESFINFIKP